MDKAQAEKQDLQFRIWQAKTKSEDYLQFSEQHSKVAAKYMDLYKDPTSQFVLGEKAVARHYLDKAGEQVKIYRSLLAEYEAAFGEYEEDMVAVSQVLDAHGDQ